MFLLLLFAFISGLVTILAPCIWPLLPIVLSSSAVGGSRAKSFGITLGIMLSFSVFTLTISSLVSIFHFDPGILRILAVVIIGFLGLSLIIPALSAKLEAVVSKFSGKVGGLTGEKRGFWGGFLTGISLGIVWSPCAGPILATIATLAITQSVSWQLVLVTAAYVTGVGIPLFFFSFFGGRLITKSRFLSPYLGRIQQVFGIIMILTAVAIYTNYDKVLQVKLLDTFPSYTKYLTALESNSAVTSQLLKLKGDKEPASTRDESTRGGPMPTTGVLNSAGKVKEDLGTSNLPIFGKAPEFTGINKWLNSDPLTMSNLKGKVVLVDFWTYTCINCIRTLPHVTSWYEKYKDKGLVVVGVHTPEFEFEKNTQNVENAVKQYQIHYPVAQDNDYHTWNAYSNQYWPAKYLIDASGNVRYTHFGEGEYDTTEVNIKKLLEEAGQGVDQTVVDMPDETPRMRLTPETYLGSGRMDPFNSDLTFEGEWKAESEFRKAGKGAALQLNFYASKVFLVIHPATGKDLVRVYLDGKLADDNSAGADVKSGLLEVIQPRLYNLIDLRGNASNHLLRLEFDTEGTQVFAFTFG